MFLFGWILNFKLENLKTCFLEEYISKIKKTSRKVSHMSSTTQICLSYRFLCLHFWIHLAEIAMSFRLSSSLLSWRYFVVTGFTKVSLSASQSVCLSTRLCLPPSFSGVTPFWHYCCDSMPICLSLSKFLSISLSLLLPSPRLMFFGCDRSRVNLCISFYWLSFSLPLSFFTIRVALEVKKLYIST